MQGYASTGPLIDRVILGTLKRGEGRVMNAESSGWREEEDEEGRIESMTVFFIINHICLATLNPRVIFT